MCLCRSGIAERQDKHTTEFSEIQMNFDERTIFVDERIKSGDERTFFRIGKSDKSGAICSKNRY